jgi:hypothetical protein
MATYIVFTRESTQDQQERDVYQANVAKTFVDHPIKISRPMDRNKCLRERHRRAS